MKSPSSVPARNIVPTTRWCNCGHGWQYHSPIGCLYPIKREADFDGEKFVITHVEYCGCQRRKT